jgi:nucleoside-diphosphate-sugar epimerase
MSDMSDIKTVLVTGGAGYVGAVLVPKLLDQGYAVKVLDLYLFGGNTLASVNDNPKLEQIKGDIRDRQALNRATRGCDAVIHLACISNDPSFDLDPELGKSINYDAFFEVLSAAKEQDVKRFVFASSSSVYGVREEENVTEDLALKPLTDYSKYKAMCEDVLLEAREPGFTTLILRPATVCGYSPRLRLDLTVNILTNHAVNNNKIMVHGGDQRRPNIHIADVTDLYVNSLIWESERIDGRIYNAGYENHRVMEIAEIVRDVVGRSVEIEVTPTQDHRSYHISSERIEQELSFVPQHGIEEAVLDLVDAFESGKISNSFAEARYSNIATMQARGLT